MNLSKSRYVKGVQCPKMLWMEQHMRDQFDDSVMNQAVLENGNMVGDLAMGYYGDFVEVPFDAGDFAGMAERTSELMEAGEPVICEATFAYEGSLCMVDILRVEPDGVHIVEVKSSTHLADVYLHDMAFQTWVLRKCGLNVKSVSLMHIDNTYVRQGELDLHQLFKIEDCTGTIFDMQAEVEQNVPYFQRYADRGLEPTCEIGDHCRKPYPCGYSGWCWRHIPKPSVFDLSRITFKKAMRQYEAEAMSFEQLRETGFKLSKRQKAQVDCELDGIEQVVDAQAVREFVDTASYPIYFLDFETFQVPVPPYDGMSPYQQVTTQFSLHVQYEPGGELEHKEFLAEYGSNPLPSVARALVEAIPMGSCVMAYNAAFEKGRISEMAVACPEYAEHLLNINEGFVDLLSPFACGSYYHRDMGGSNSIKAVLPALFPNDPQLDYHALEGVHNGAEAMNAFVKLGEMEPAQVAEVREQLLRYCELDTLAMVKIWQKLEAVQQMGTGPFVAKSNGGAEPRR